MREKHSPWNSAAFCASLALITMVGNLLTFQSGGSDGSLMMIYLINLPMCFYFIGGHLVQLRNENHEMRLRLDKLERPKPDSRPSSTN